MADRTFTAHIEKTDGSYSCFKTDAPTVKQAFEQAQEQLDPGEILAGVTED